MPKLLRRDRKAKATEPQATEPQAAGTDAAEADTAMADVPGQADAPEAAPEPAPAPAPTATRPAPAPGDGDGGNGGNGYETIKTSGGLLSRMYGEPGERSRADRDREAALEFEQAVAPVLDMLQGAVPGASSPDEAARTLESQVGELRPDPGAGAYIPGDRYDREARVYYRLLRRDYEKDPRPSLTRNRRASHHLHGQYKAFPGTKGW